MHPADLSTSSKLQGVGNLKGGIPCGNSGYAGDTARSRRPGCAQHDPRQEKREIAAVRRRLQQVQRMSLIFG